MNSSSESTNPIPAWRFWLPLLFQTVLILSVPAQAVYTHLTGKTVILQTAPVDPYDFLRGYYQTLGYDISQVNNLRKLPGWNDLPKHSPSYGSTTSLADGTRIYLVLEQPQTAGAAGLPQPWKPIRISSTLPTQLSANQVVLKGVSRYNTIEYGLETYYMPEDQRDQINQDLNDAQQRNPADLRQKSPIVVETKVDAQGNAVPVSIWVRFGKPAEKDIRNYRF